MCVIKQHYGYIYISLLLLVLPMRTIFLITVVEQHKVEVRKALVNCTSREVECSAYGHEVRFEET